MGHLARILEESRHGENIAILPVLNCGSCNGTTVFEGRTGI